jgi:hypothetical protein
MVTFLEIGLLRYFSIIFPALLVFALVYALLQKTQMLGKSISMNAIIAIVAAFLVMLSEDVIALINFIAPWFILFFLFIVLLLIVYKIFGASDENLKSFITTDRPVQWAIFAVGVLIVVAGLSHVYGQRLLPVTLENETNLTSVQAVGTATSSFRENVTRIFFNPKIIGLILIMFIAVFAIALLTRETI